MTKTVNQYEGRETLNTRVLLATAELGHVGRSVGTVTSQQPCYSSDDVIKKAPKRLKQHTVQTSSSGALISGIEAKQPIWYQILQIQALIIKTVSPHKLL